MEALKFIEQDRGVVSWLTMPCIPKEKRWSSLHKTQYLSKDFVGEEQCRIEATTGIISKCCFLANFLVAIFDPQLAYEVIYILIYSNEQGPTEGFADDENAWERVRRESES